MSRFEAENDPPIGGDRDAPETRQVALQRMQPETGQIHVLRSFRLIKAGQCSSDLLNVVRIEAAMIGSFVEPFQSAVSKPLDHEACCNVTSVTCQSRGG